MKDKKIKKANKTPKTKGDFSTDNKDVLVLVSKIKKEFSAEVVTGSNGFMFKKGKDTFLTLRNINKKGEATLSLSKLDIKSNKSKVPNNLTILAKKDGILRLKKFTADNYNKVLPLIKASFKAISSK